MKVLHVWFVLLLSMSLVSSIGVARADSKENNSRIQNLEADVANLEAKVAYFEQVLRFLRIEEGEINGLNGPHVIFEGANVHIQSGSGSSGVLDGWGNLIVGYNEAGPSTNLLNRYGSHNLVVGNWHEYPSFGGFVAGSANKITGPNASISGGQDNEASGYLASVSGGQGNKASGPRSIVSGGRDNEAGHNHASVSGGWRNMATGDYSTVSGGHQNIASSLGASVSGGFRNEASANAASISGGQQNIATEHGASVSGGFNRIAGDRYDWAAGSLWQDY
jgi:hypothetical protein